MTPPAPEIRAARLVRFYPAGWRDRYGAEFTELLAADLAERPRCWRRTADVAASGLLARLSQAGLGGQRTCHSPLVGWGDANGNPGRSALGRDPQLAPGPAGGRHRL